MRHNGIEIKIPTKKFSFGQILIEIIISHSETKFTKYRNKKTKPLKIVLRETIENPHGVGVFGVIETAFHENLIRLVLEHSINFFLIL